jgi:quinol monooxygenase YgiN
MSATPSGPRRPVTFINVFTVEPADQQRLVDILTHVTAEYVRHAAGFVASRLHRSLDGRKVAMYGQWRSMADYEAMRADPRPRSHLEEALTIARFEPGSYEVVADFTPPG